MTVRNKFKIKWEFREPTFWLEKIVKETKILRLNPKEVVYHITKEYSINLRIIPENQYLLDDQNQPTIFAQRILKDIKDLSLDETLQGKFKYYPNTRHIEYERR